MKRSAKAKPDLIVLSDEDSASKSPVKKVERKERRANEPSDLSREVDELKQKVAKLESDRQGAIRIAGEAQGRVEFLENLLDKKQGTVEDDGKKKEEVVELKEKLNSLTLQMEAERSRDRQRIDELTRKLAQYEGDPTKKQEVEELRKNVATLTQQLAAEKSASGERKRSHASGNAKKSEEATRNVEGASKREYEQSQQITALKFEVLGLKKTIGSMHTDHQLQERANFLTQQLSGELCKANGEKERDRARIDALTLNFNEEQLKDRKRIYDLTRKLAEAEEASLQLPLPQPPVPPSQEIMILEQKVAKLEKDYQSASQIAGEAQSRVKFLENLIGNKPRVTTPVGKCADKWEVEALKKEVRSLTVQLASRTSDRMRDKERIDQLRRNANDDQKRMDELKRKLADMAKQQLPQEHPPPSHRIAGEAQSRVKFMENLIDQKPVVAAAKNDIDKRQMEELKKKVDSLTQQMEEERTKHKEISKKKDERIAEFMRKVDESDVEKGGLLLQAPPTPHPTNILQSCIAGTPETISYVRAAEQLSAKYYGRRNKKWRRQCGEIATRLNCELCWKSFKNGEIFTHFFSPQHAKQMRSRNASVSLAAVQYWLRKLGTIPKPAAVAATALDSTAAAAHPTVSAATVATPAACSAAPTVPAAAATVATPAACSAAPTVPAAAAEVGGVSKGIKRAMVVPEMERSEGCAMM